MLQWMGGSRRKVATSRQSTQKRQKQYFEQRKRQQQTGPESFADERLPRTYQVQNRSLDILSLLNLSTVVRNYNSTCSTARENLEGGDATLSCNMFKGQPTIQTAKVTPVDSSEFRERGYPSGNQAEVVCPKKGLSRDHDIQTKDLMTNDERRGNLKLSDEICNPSRFEAEIKWQKKAPEGQNIESVRSDDIRNKSKTTSGQQLSVFDLIWDDGPNGNCEERPSSEAHVAFSIEGLGEMGSETPVHSPEQPARNFTYGSLSHIKARRQSHFSKELDNLLYDLEVETATVTQQTDFPLYGSPLEPPFFSESRYNRSSKMEDMHTCNEPWQYINNDVKSKNYFADDEMFWEIDNGDDNWRAVPSSHAGPSLHEDCNMSWKSSALKMDDNSADCWNIGVQENPDFTSLGPNFHKISVAERTKEFNTSDSADRYFKQQAEMDPDLRTFADGVWSPKNGRQYGRTYVTSPVGPSYQTEDTEDNLSLLSEESCSSNAVRGRSMKEKQGSTSMASQEKERHGYETKTCKESIPNLRFQNSLKRRRIAFCFPSEPGIG